MYFPNDIDFENDVNSTTWLRKFCQLTCLWRQINSYMQTGSVRGGDVLKHVKWNTKSVNSSKIRSMKRWRRICNYNMKCGAHALKWTTFDSYVLGPYTCISPPILSFPHAPYSSLLSSTSMILMHSIYLQLVCHNNKSPLI